MIIPVGGENQRQNKTPTATMQNLFMASGRAEQTSADEKLMLESQRLYAPVSSLHTSTSESQVSKMLW